MNVIVRDPDESLAYAEPATVRDRTRFENDSSVHSARLAELAPEALRLTDALLGFRPFATLKYLNRARRGRRRMREQLRARRVVRNTYSEELAGEHWNPSVSGDRGGGSTG